jgi:hypothetical protein
MKYKIAILAFLFCFTTIVPAQTGVVSSHEISWKGVEKWSIGQSNIDVISFDGAQYPSDNHLPYFNKRIICEKGYNYLVKIINEIYSPLTAEESNLLTASQTDITGKVVISTEVLHERETDFLDIRILPFVNQQGKISKLQSFNLETTKINQPQKAIATTRHTYSTSSVLAQGKFVKIKIANTGVYKLTYDDLNSMGISPANVRIFGYGGNVLEQSFLQPKIDDLPEVAIWMEKGADGIFNSGDYILFYGQGVTKWTYDKSRSAFNHTVNTYSSYGYYFVTSDAGVGKKIEPKSITLASNPTIVPVEEFIDFQLYENDKLSFTKSGKEFYGEKFDDIISVVIPFNFPNPVLTNTTSARLDVASTSVTNSNFNLSLNGSQNKILTVPAKSTTDNYEQARGTSANFMYTPSSDTFSFGLNYIKSTSSSVGYLNFLEVNTRRQLKMAGSVMPFQNLDYLGTATYSQYKLSATNSNVKIWDITDPSNINSIQTTVVDNKLTFIASDSAVSRYLAIDPTASAAFAKPIIENVVPNQNLHALEPVDMIILTHPNFLSQAETLAKAHREKDNMTVEVVTTEQVYNEFSSGTPDATAYRWVMKMLYDKAKAANNLNDLPKYLLLFGRGSYDNRGIIPNSGNNLILTYQAENSLHITQSYITDDYFTLLDDNEGSNISSNLMDLGVGRLPVSTTTQATNVVNKIINYMDNQSKGSWKNQLCFLADDGDQALHMTQADSITASLARSIPAFQINKIYLDASLQEISASGESYPLAKSKFQNLLRSGLLLLDYTGHAGPTGWGNEGILSIPDVKNLSNKNLPLFYGATCDFLQFDVQDISAGEQVLLNPAGGGIGIISAARPVYASQNMTLNKLFCENLFKKKNGEHQRIGDVLPYAKNNVGSEINKLSYIYMGDPALRLTYPTRYKVLTTKINESSIFGNDTLRALSVASIQGIIEDDNGNMVTNFNGTIHVTVYDKMQRITTMNNEHDGALTYSDRPNTLFSGDAVVTAGEYKFSFMLPKDIKYNYGTGRINYYAEDDVNDYEAQGYFENFIVGGTNINNIIDTTGPDIQLFLNSTNFVSGDKVNETPLFISSISDIHGINTVGSGIGHDLMLTVDDDPSQSFVINDYFQANADSFTTGSVRYKLPEMKNGKHTLTFKAWDLLNNSASTSIEFEVVKGLTPEIFKVYNYPNPVKTTNITTIVVDNDRPETILNTYVEIFDIAGRKIWSKSQSNADNITWNLITDNGSKAKTGIYFYRVNIKTTNSAVCSKTNKMLIVEQ